MGNWKTRASAASVTGACVFALATGAGAVFAGDWWGQHHGPVVVQFINGPAGDAKAKQSHAGRVHARRSPALDKSTVPAGPESDVNKPYPQTSQVPPAPLRATARAAPRMAPCGSTMAETGPTMVRAGASAPVRTVCTSSPAAPSSAAPSSRPRRQVPRRQVPRRQVPRRQVPRRLTRRQVPSRLTRRQAQYCRAGDRQAQYCRAGDRQAGHRQAGDPRPRTRQNLPVRRRPRRGDPRPWTRQNLPVRRRPRRLGPESGLGQARRRPAGWLSAPSAGAAREWVHGWALCDWRAT